MGGSLFKRVVVVVESWFARVGLDVIGWKEGWNALFSHETAFNLLNNVVSCHREVVSMGKSMDR